ncbi:MAG: hypothetical protein COZ50_11470, partial [Zetaproteobacteria bacterium CG_4_10_14_3_um_filter_54_28]
MLQNSIKRLKSVIFVIRPHITGKPQHPITAPLLGLIHGRIGKLHTTRELEGRLRKKALHEVVWVKSKNQLYLVNER